MSFNASNTALLVIDVQKKFFRGPTAVYNKEGLIKNINHLILEAQDTKVPIIYIQNYNKVLHQLGEDGMKLHPSLSPAEGDLVINRQQSSAFKETILHEELSKRGISKIVVTGLITQGSIKSTCIDGRQLGYDVVLIEDSHSNYNQNAEQVIEEWNEKLEKENIVLLKTRDINFI